MIVRRTQSYCRLALERDGILNLWKEELSHKVLIGSSRRVGFILTETSHVMTLALHGNVFQPMVIFQIRHKAVNVLPWDPYARGAPFLPFPLPSVLCVGGRVLRTPHGWGYPWCSAHGVFPEIPSCWQWWVSSCDQSWGGKKGYLLGSSQGSGNSGR